MADLNMRDIWSSINFGNRTTGASGNKNSRTVETADFIVEGHLLKWNNVAIQIDNVSMISSENPPLPVLPAWTLWATILGLLALIFGGSSYSYSMTIIQQVGLIAFVIGLCVFGMWMTQVKTLSKHKYLHILLNCGITYSIEFVDVDYLEKVLAAFEDIFKKGTDDTTYYYFDLKHSYITGSQVGSINNNK